MPMTLLLSLLPRASHHKRKGGQGAWPATWDSASFESPADFLDLVMKLRETQSSKYTQRDTPILTCVQMPMEKILEQLF